MDAALRELLTSDVLYRPRTGSDKYDSPTYGDFRALRARVVDERREFRTSDSRLVTTHGYLILDADAAEIAERGQFQIDGEELEVLGVSKPRDLDGSIHHVKAWI